MIIIILFFMYLLTKHCILLSNDSLPTANSYKYKRGDLTTGLATDN